MKQSDRSMPVRSLFERRRIVLAFSALLMACVFVLRQSTSDVGDGIMFLYVIPVALTALEFGAAAGLGASLLAGALIGIWLLTLTTTLAADDLLVETGVLAGTAVIAGRFSSRMRDAHRRQRQLLSSGLALADRTEHAMLALLVARRALELVPAQGVRVEVEGYEPATVGRLDDETLQLGLGTADAPVGRITIARPAARAFTPDERLALEVLASQATVAAENERLLALEREQAALHAKLTATQGALAEQGRRLELLFDHQEAERTVIAHELHDQAAQALAAIQLGLRAIEHDLSSEPSRAHVEYLRATLNDTLRTLRELAVGLRPPALDQLGLEPALRDLATRAGEHAGQPVTIALTGLAQVPPALETTIYRLVDDVIAMLGAPVRIEVGIGPGGGTLRLEATRASARPASAASAELLARIRARLDLIGGSLVTLGEGQAHRRLSAAIPVSGVCAESLPAEDPAGSDCSSLSR